MKAYSLRTAVWGVNRGGWVWAVLDASVACVSLLLLLLLDEQERTKSASFPLLGVISRLANETQKFSGQRSTERKCIVSQTSCKVHHIMKHPHLY